MQPYTGRLAPAPTGALHLGNARTFLVACLRAQKRHGSLTLRLEDLDHPKTKPNAAAQAYQDLHWLGLAWTPGPENSFHPVTQTVPEDDPCIQSTRTERYTEILETLIKNHKIYPCTCTRKDLDHYLSAPNAGEDATERRYPNLCRDRYASYEDASKASPRDPAWRFRIDDDAISTFTDAFQGEQTSRLAEWSGDFPVARGHHVGYQLAVVIDDHDMGVTEVVRGDDLIPSTHRQLALYAALDWKPPRFFHLPLVVGPDGRRLAKRHGDTRLSLLRERGDAPDRVLGWLAHSCGWTDSLREMPLAEILDLCDCSRLPRERVVVGDADLEWLGFQHG
jgi:glutamyl-tRNA synthetase